MKYLSIIFLSLLTSCTFNNIATNNNPQKGKMKETCCLNEIGEKKFPLDAETATKPIYTQIFVNNSGDSIFSLLNSYNNSIYLYDYKNMDFIKKIHYEKEGPNGIIRPMGYYIKSLDSIYVFDGMKMEISVSDSAAVVRNRILLKTSLDNQWALYNPQYSLSTINPITLRNNHLLMVGFAPFSLPEKYLDTFFFSTSIDVKTNEIANFHKYPKELYGHNYNWEGGYSTMVYPCLLGNNIYYSFPISHDIFIYNFENDDYHKVYGGSNYAESIKSINHEQRRTPDELIAENFLTQNLYGALLYDNYRKIYYRFMLNSIPNAKITTPIEEKKISVIIMDCNFKYLGESIIGDCGRWNYKNAFITSEGLNIEFIDKKDFDENFLRFRTFTICSKNRHR